MFIHKLINWYEKNKRDLPWRNTKDPYKIWLSEIILQQTRVNQGLPYYEKFIEYYPKVSDLAEADEAEILRIWQGLGYYSRARNLHKTAQVIHNQYFGKFPVNFEEIIKLKGIGQYTAAAIASIAFEQAVAAIDGNAIRVFSRFLGYKENVDTPASKKYLFNYANTFISQTKPSVFNQAIMEIGALICKPKNPNCQICPLKDNCEAFLKNQISAIPLKNKKTKAKELELNYAVLICDAHIFVKKRSGIWKNLYDFIELDQFSLEDFMDNLNLKNLNIHPQIFKTHILTHLKLSITFNIIEIKEDSLPNLNTITGEWVSFEKFEILPKPIVIENLRKEILPLFSFDS